MGAPIARSLVEQALALAAGDPLREVCGLLLGRGGRVEALLPTANVAADPADAFEIDPAALIAAHRAARNGGPIILGCYHSHPGGSILPSSRDIAAAVPGQYWLIVAHRDAALFRFHVNGFVPIAIDPA